MKKIVVSIACLVALSFAAVPVGAQTRSRCTSRQYNRSGRVYSNQVYSNQVYRNSSSRYGAYNNQVSRNSDYYGNSGYYGNNGYYDDRSVWQRSRDKITTAAGAGAGAVIGGMIGGKRGAIIGAIAGGGGAAIYTYKIRDKYRRY